jgi:hypothetical protein
MRRRFAFTTMASALVLLVVVSLDAQAASAPHFAAPTEYGVIDLGDPVHFELDSPDCARVPVRAELVSGDLTVFGPPAKGCSGTAWLPSAAKAIAAGYAEGRPAKVAIVAGHGDGKASVDLRLMRREFDQQIAPDSRVVGSDDPRETAGEDAAVLEMEAGDVVEFASTDLSSIRSITIRSAVETDPQLALWELRADHPESGALVSAGDLGHVGKSPANGGFYPSRWYTLSFRAPPIAPATEELLPVTGVHLLYFRLLAASSPVRLNWIDFNGTGARDVSVSRFSPDPASTETLFDAGQRRGFDDWDQCGWTIPVDETNEPLGMRADFLAASPEEGGPAACPTGPTATYVGKGEDGIPEGYFRNVRIRLRYRLEQFEDNGGVVLGGQEFQMHDRGEWFTGGYHSASTCSDAIQPLYLMTTIGLTGPMTECGYPADRIKTYTYPDWAEMEIIQNGPDYLVRINGRDVTRYHRTQNVVTADSFVLSNFFATSNTIAAPTELDHVWYDDIRLYHCAGETDATGRSPDRECSTDSLTLR